MTNNQHRQVPEALRLADEFKLCIEYDSIPSITDIAKAEAELLRLHAYCQELEAQVILDCMTHVQKRAEIEHVAGDVSKNGAEMNVSTQPVAQQGAPIGSIEHTLWVLSEHNALHFGENHSTVIQARRALAALRIQQPAPATQPQAGAVPLTEAQRNAIYDKHCFLGDNGWEIDWWLVIDEVEAAHGIGIKGGQHGTE